MSRSLFFDGGFVGTSTAFNVAPIVATGGTVTQANGYKIHTFTSGDTFTVSKAVDVEYLIIAGGGGGGGNGGGGGAAGGLLTNVGGTALPLTPGPYTITIGTGGAYLGNPLRGEQGVNSTALGLTAIGGGGGGSRDGTEGSGGNGGSGGGAGGVDDAGAVPGTGTAGQGNDGGDNEGNGVDQCGGGGGGAGAVGGLATAGTSGGDGGAGVSNDITGSSVFYAGGGAGAVTINGVSGTGGIGGGGSKIAGKDGLGGGGAGGGAGATGGDGGDGVVIMRYLQEQSSSGVYNLDAVFDSLYPLPEPVIDREFGLSITRTEVDGAIAAYSVTERGQNVAFACDVVFPTTPADADLMSMGGGTTGCFIGFSSQSGALRFRVRAGGGTTLTSSDTVTAILDTTDYPADGLIHTVVWDFQINPGRVRLWIDGVLRGSGVTTGGGVLNGSTWTGTAAGGYLGAPGGPTGEPATDWTADAGNSTLRVYINQLVTNDG